MTSHNSLFSLLLLTVLGNPLNGFDKEITDSQSMSEPLSQLLGNKTKYKIHINM